MIKSNLILLLQAFLVCYAKGLVQEDRVSALVQTVHAGWKTPWLELSLGEMPRFMLNEAVLLHPVLPKKDENDKKTLWNPDMDAKLSFTFSESKLSAPAILLYSAEGKSLEKISFIFEHDGHDIISLSHTETYRDLGGQTLPDLSSARHPPVDVEYVWMSVQEEDLNLRVKVMFTATIFMTMGLVWVIITTYDGDTSTPPRRRSSSISRGRAGSGGGAGITVNKRR